jgi:CubicO group peptidase (beta-lactamase class C family)
MNAGAEKMKLGADVQEIERIAEKNNFSGVISGFSRGGFAYAGSFGFRDRARRLSPDADTLFGIASGTKTFTAAAILALAAAGRLSLESRVLDITGPLDGIDSQTEIRHLLTHTSGIWDYYDEELVTDFDHFTTAIPWSELTTPADYLPLFTGHQPKFRPEERFSYSNGGYVLLGCCLELVTGQLYRDAVRDLVLEPAGMVRSGFHAFGELPENTAVGYCPVYREAGSTCESSEPLTFCRWETNADRLPLRGGGDGGMYTSALELQRFWEALYGGALLGSSMPSPGKLNLPGNFGLSNMLDEMVMPRQQVGSSLWYGYGIYIQEIGNRRIWRMSGCDAGVGCEAWYQPETGRGWSLLSNVTDGASVMVPATAALFQKG